MIEMGGNQPSLLCGRTYASFISPFKTGLATIHPLRPAQLVRVGYARGEPVAYASCPAKLTIQIELMIPIPFKRYNFGYRWYLPIEPDPWCWIVGRRVLHTVHALACPLEYAVADSVEVAEKTSVRIDFSQRTTVYTNSITADAFGGTTGSSAPAA